MSFGISELFNKEFNCFSCWLSCWLSWLAEWGTWVRARMLVSRSAMRVSFLFLPDSATVSFVLYVKNSALIRSYRVMPPKSRATQCLLAHNVSPARESQKRSRSERQEAEVQWESSKGSRHNSPPGKERRSRSKSSSRSKSKSIVGKKAPRGARKEWGASAISREGIEVSAVYGALPYKIATT